MKKHFLPAFQIQYFQFLVINSATILNKSFYSQTRDKALQITIYIG